MSALLYSRKRQIMFETFTSKSDARSDDCAGVAAAAAMAAMGGTILF